MGKEMSNHPVWWHEWAPKIVAKYNLKKTGVNHYNGPCPQCIGTDRFYMSEKAGVVRINCNQGCNFKDLTQTMRDDGAWPEFIKGEPIAPMPRMNGNPFANYGSSSQLYHDIKGVPLYGAAVVDTSVVIKVIAKDLSLIHISEPTRR